MMGKTMAAIGVLLLCVASCWSQALPAGAAIETEFSARYAAWKVWWANNPTSPDPTDCNEYRSIIALGPRVIPILIRTISIEENAFFLTSAIRVISKVFVPRDRWPGGRVGGVISAVKVYQTWWNVDRKKRKDTYNDLSTKWNELKASENIPRSHTGLPLLWYDQTVYDPQSGTLMALQRHQITEIGQVYLNIQYLGIDVLPLIAADLEQKKYDFLPIFIELTKCPIDEKERRAEQRATAVLAWWKAEKDKWIIPEQ